jgi:hypothetical protein
MSTLLTEARDGQVYTGYDNLRASSYCTPTFLGCAACITPGIVDGYLAVYIIADTPFGRVTTNFKITNGTKFTWKPFSRFKLDIEIKNLIETGNSYGFDGAFSVCLDVPYFGWKCGSFASKLFYTPRLLKASEELSDADFINMLALPLLLEQ